MCDEVAITVHQSLVGGAGYGGYGGYGGGYGGYGAYGGGRD